MPTAPARTYTVSAAPALNPHRLTGLSARRRRLHLQRKSDFWALLDSRNLNLTQVAARTALSHSYISRIIAGSRTPSLRATLDLARVLGLTLAEMASYLLPDTEIV